MSDLVRARGSRRTGTAMKLRNARLNGFASVALFFFGCVGFVSLILFLSGCQPAPKAENQDRSHSPTSPGIALLLDDTRTCEKKFGSIPCLFCANQPNTERCLVESVGKDWSSDEFVLAQIEAQFKTYRLVLLSDCMERHGEPGIQGHDEGEMLRLATSSTGSSCIVEVQDTPIEQVFEKGAALVAEAEKLSNVEGL